MNKQLTSKILNVAGLAGLISLIVLMVIPTTKELLKGHNDIVKLIFSGSSVAILTAALISGVIGAKGMPVKRSEHPKAFWFLFILYALFAFTVITDGFKR